MMTKAKIKKVRRKALRLINTNQDLKELNRCLAILKTYYGEEMKEDYKNIKK